MGTVRPSPAVEAVERLLRHAREEGLSDLHLDPSEEGLVVTGRRDGVLEPVETLPAEIAPRVVGRLKALADLLAYRTDVPQEGRIAADRGANGSELRVATFPTLLGERVALRFDAPDGAPRALAALGLPDGVRNALESAIERPEGVVLLTGPSGSGKTTTLYSCLHHLLGRKPARCIVTVEDPVERRIPGVAQAEVNEAAGLSYARALRSLLRQDPDVLMVGEIRDRETAAIALEAGLTGHLVGSTIHAGTALQVFSRLLGMGIEPFVLTTAIRGVLAQRLVRRLRPDGNGYAGRTLLVEWLRMGPALRRAVLDRADGDALSAAAREDGWTDLRAEAEVLVANGVTNQEEVNRVLGSLSEAAVASDDVALFHRTLAELCRAEVPLPRALDVLRREVRGPLRSAVAELHAEVETGTPLPEAYARLRHRFPPAYAALVEAGTEAGDLPAVLRDIAEHAARAAETARRIRRALSGPLVTAAFVLVLGVGAVLLVAPTTWEYTSTIGQTSPLPIALGALGLVAALVLGAFVVAGWRRPGPGEGRLRVPVLGRLRRDSARASFAGTLALLLRREVPLPRALELTATTMGSRPVRERVEAMAARAREGAGLAASLGDDLLEPSLLWLIEAADGSRDAATALEDVAAIHRGRLERGLDGALVLVRPLAELIIGVAVFGLAYCFLIPLFSYAEGIFRW